MIGILSMSKRLILAALGAALLVFSVPFVGHADDTGLASIHTWRKIGKKTCFVDHYHDGNGTAATRDKAEASAIRNWVEFTALEYGSDWSSFGNAASKTMTCRQSMSEWICDLAAIPCRGR